MSKLAKTWGVALILWVGSAELAQASDDSWMSRPAIVEIRQIYSHAQRSIADGNLEKLSREIPDHECQGWIRTLNKTLWLNDQGRVISYRVERDSEHTMISSQAYYDHAQRPRFVFSIQESYYELSGLSRTEYRTYFSPGGDLIKHDIRQTHRSGMRGALEAWDLVDKWVASPRRHFNESVCN